MRHNEAAALLGRLHHAQNDLYQGGEPAELRDILTADIAWHVPGDNAITGDYHGHDEVLGYMLKRRNLAAATMHIQPRVAARLLAIRRRPRRRHRHHRRS